MVWVAWCGVSYDGANFRARSVDREGILTQLKNLQMAILSSHHHKAMRSTRVYGNERRTCMSGMRTGGSVANKFAPKSKRSTRVNLHHALNKPADHMIHHNKHPYWPNDAGKTVHKFSAILHKTINHAIRKLSFLTRVLEACLQLHQYLNKNINQTTREAGGVTLWKRRDLVALWEKVLNIW